MTNVLDQAQNVRGVVSAARFRDRMARREATATDPAERRAAREAIFDVEERFHDLADVPVGGAERFARERGHGRGSRSPVHEGRRRAAPAAGGGHAKPAAKPAPTGGARKTSRPARRPPRASGRPTPRVDRAIRRTGIPATADSGGSLVMSAVGVTVGMGLAYLVLASAEAPGSGSRRVRHLLESAVPGAVGRFLSPYDDFFASNGLSRTGEGHTGRQATGRYHGKIDVPTPGFHPFHKQGGSRR